VDIIVNLAKMLHDVFVVPALKGAAQIDTDNLAENTGINPFCVI
jgi:hypothetical protein